MKVLGIIAACVVGVIVLFALIGTSEPPTNPAEAIKDACQQQFGSEGQDKVMACQIQLFTRRLQENEDGKLRRANEQSR